jgi:hypothetical protein
MDMSARGPAARDALRVSTEQARYARVLDWTMKISLAAIVCCFVAYTAGIAPARLPITELPDYWSLPLREFVGRAGAVTGWSWLALLHRGEYLLLGAMAMLTAVPLICILAIAPVYAARRDWAYLGITALLAGVLMLAACGLAG